MGNLEAQSSSKLSTEAWQRERKVYCSYVPRISAKQEHAETGQTSRLEARWRQTGKESPKTARGVGDRAKRLGLDLPFSLRVL